MKSTAAAQHMDFDLLWSSGKTSQVSYPPTITPLGVSLLASQGKLCRSSHQGANGQTLVLCLAPKEQSHGASSMPNISAWPNDAAVSLLSQALEKGLIPARFYLSKTACEGILRRAEKRRKTLPPMLDQALRRQVSEPIPKG